MNGICSALGGAFAAHLASAIVDVCQIVFYLYCIVGTDFETFVTTGTRHRAIFPCNAALVFIDTRHKDFAVFFELLAQFDDISWTCFHAGGASRTIGVVHYGKPRGAVHRQSVELARLGAVAAAKTTVGAIGVAAIKRVLYGAGQSPVIYAGTRTVIGRTVATNNSH